jgi:hypothetical protein
MSFFSRFRRRKEDEASRFARLLSTGRIVEGSIVDVTADKNGLVAQVFFNYNVAGVEYESSQALNDEQRNRRKSYTPGATIIVRYDPYQPGNSIVV